MLNSRLFTLCLSVAIGACLVAMPARDARAQAAQAYPTRPVTIIWPFPPTAVTAIAWRAISAEASKVLGQPLVFDSRPGARTRLGVNAMAKAPADGYLLNIAIDSLLVAQPIADPEFKMELGKDYTTVAFGYQFPFILVTTTGLPFRDLKGLIAYAKSNPGKLNVAITPASTTHFVSERFLQAAGLQLTLVPYKGGDSTIDLVAGRVDLLFSSTTVAPFVSAGKLNAIATTGAQRWSPFPDVPTLTELGLPVPTTVWFGVIAHANTPADVIAKLNSAFNAALKVPEVRKMLDGYGFATGSYTTPNEFATFIQSEVNAWKPVIQKAGIKLE